MAGTVTATSNNKKVMVRGEAGTVRLYEYTVTSAADGSVTESLPYIEGELQEVEIVITEANAPTNLFDLYLKNDATSVSFDLLGASGVNIAVAADAVVIPLVGAAYKGKVMPRSGAYLVCANMGNATAFTLRLFVKR